MTSQKLFYFTDPKKYHDNGLGFSLSPAPRYEILSITTHDPQKKISHAYNTLEELAEFCPTRFVVDQNKLHIAVQKVQRIRIWKEGNPKPQLTYDSKSFIGYQVAHGECILELIHNNTAATIRIHLNLSTNTKVKTVSPVEFDSTGEQQMTTTVNSTSPIKGLRAHLDSTREKASSRPAIKPQYQETEVSTQRPEPLHSNTPASPTEHSPDNAEDSSVSSEQLQHIETIVDDLLARLDQTHALVDALIEQQAAHNTKQTELEASIQQVVPELTSLLQQ